MEELAFSFLALKPDESDVAKGNIAENPIFVLSNREARPAFNSKEELQQRYTRRIAVTRRSVAGRPVERSVTLDANPQFGFPTVFACRLLIAIIQEAVGQGLQSEEVSLGRSDLLLRIGCKKPRKYEALSEALNALRTANLQLRDTWLDNGRTRAYAVDSLIACFSFCDDRELSAWPDAIHLSRFVFQNLKVDRLSVVDLEAMNEDRKLGIVLTDRLVKAEWARWQ